MNEDPAPAPLGLRLATNADGPAVRELVFGILAEYGLKPDPTGADADLFDVEGRYARVGGWFAVLVDPSDGVMGSVGLLPLGGGNVELRKMYLDRRHRGRGFGRRLLAAAIDEARRRGFRRMTLETATVLKEAIGLYEANGFRRVDHAPNVCRCDLVMERTLE